MTKEVFLGGEMRPVRFGMASLLIYEEQTGRSAITDFANSQKNGQSLSLVVDLVNAGLLCGYRQSGATPQFSRYDVADWIGEDMGAVEPIMQLFAASMPGAKNGNPPNPKASKK